MNNLLHPKKRKEPMNPDPFSLVPKPILSDIISLGDYDDLLEVTRLKNSTPTFRSVVSQNHHFINTFNHRLNSPTWVFQHFFTQQDPHIGTLVGVRLRDNTSIMHHLDAQPPAVGEVQGWNPENTFQLLDVSGNYFLFLVRNSGNLLVKNPYTRVDRVIPVPPNSLFDGEYHIEIIRVQNESFQIRYCRVISNVPHYHLYSSQTQEWIPQPVPLIGLLEPEGDQTKMFTIVENGFNYHIMFLNGVDNNPCFKRSPILPEWQGQMNVIGRYVYFGRWMLFYTYHVVPGSSFMELHNVVLTRRNSTGDGYNLVSDIPGYLIDIPSIVIQSVSCREIEGSIVVGLKNWLYLEDQYVNGNYIFSYIIGSGNPGHWNRTGYMVNDGANHSQIVITNRLTLPVPV